jgi:hypothetical protein
MVNINIRTLNQWCCFTFNIQRRSADLENSSGNLKKLLLRKAGIIGFALVGNFTVVL